MRRGHRSDAANWRDVTVRTLHSCSCRRDTMDTYRRHACGMGTPTPDVVRLAVSAARVRRRIALVAHDNKKRDLLEWARFNRTVLAAHDLYGTGTTGGLLQEELGLPVTRFQSGPLGGDQQLGSRIAEGEIDLVLFFWDPLESQPHDPDVRALLRIAVVWNIPIACNRATADYLISSPLLASDYQPDVPDYVSRFEHAPPPPPKRLVG